jgi:hypothetical protein
MILYHGSNTVVREIDLDKCRPYKDFGRGFYLTNIKEQAKTMSIKVAGMYGGESRISVFELDEKIYNDDSLNCLSFPIADNDWATFVMNNRIHNNSNLKEKLCNKDNKYDMVYGLVANDDLSKLFRDYLKGMMTVEILARALEYKKLSTQYSFHTDRAIKYLTFLEEQK